MLFRGEDFNDLWKLAVIDGKATRIVPVITWPDGTTETMRTHN